MINLTPEQQARVNIDRLLEQAGWAVQNADAINLYASSGVAVREFALKPGHGHADYLLYINQKVAGVVEAKPEGFTLTGVEIQSEKYSTGLPDSLPAYRRPLPFLYESTGAETQFTNGLDPEPRSRPTFSFHTPETLAEWIGGAGTGQGENSTQGQIADPGGNYLTSDNLRQRLKNMPPLDASGLWPAQKRAISNLEESLAAGRPRALVQMATGSGKTFMACNQVYRLIRHAGARRVLFLVDRSNLGRQTQREFQGFTTPDDGRKFTELYNVQLLQSSRIDPVPLRTWTTDRLWQAYRQLDQSKVRGSGQRVLADIVSLVRYAIGEADELAPFADRVHERFRGWLAMQETVGRSFTAEQIRWLESIRDHIAGSVSIELNDFQYAPFNQQGGLARAHALFGEELPRILEELNLELVA